MDIVGRAPSYRKYIQRPSMAAQLVPGSSFISRHSTIIKLDYEIPLIDYTDDSRRTDYGRSGLIQSFQLPAFTERVLDHCYLILYEQHIHTHAGLTAIYTSSWWLGGLLVERRTSVSLIRGSIPGQVAAV